MRLRVAALLLIATSASAQNSEVLQLLSDADRAYDAEKWDDAAEAYDRAIAADPRGVKPEAYSKRATIYLIDKDYQAGLDWVTRVAEKTHPGDASILTQKALLLSQLPKRADEALELAETLVAKKPPNVYVLHLLIGDTYSLAGAGAAAKTVAAYEGYLATRPSERKAGDKLIRVKLGFAYLHTGDFDAAERTLAEAKRAKGDARLDANAQKGLCAVYAGRHDWDKAVTVCEEVLLEHKAVLKGDPSPHYNLGLAYLNRDRRDDALGEANAYIQARPKDAKGYLLRGKVHFRQEEYERAEAELGKARELAPTSIEVTRELGKVFLKQKRADKAIEMLSQAVAQNPDRVDAVAALAEAYLASGKGADCATQAERALTLPGQAANVQLLTLAGEGHYDAGELSPARTAFQKALAASKDKRVKRLLVLTINRQAGEKWAAGEGDLAEELLRQALELEPESVITSYNLGVILVEKKEYTDAIKLLRVRLEQQPNDAATNRVIAKAIVAMGDPVLAAQHYARADAQAKKDHDAALQAEVNVEWGALLVSLGNLDEAVDKLERAVQLSNGPTRTEVSDAAKRNLMVARSLRGLKRLRARRSSEAAADLEGATREPRLLVGTEEDVFTFALGLAYLGAGQEGKALAIFQKTAKSPEWLKAPWNQIGTSFFIAYALYREGSSTGRAKAAPVFEKLVGKTSGTLQRRMKDLVASSWELVAYDLFVKGQAKEADKALKKAAAAAASSGDRRALDHNLAVLAMGKGPGAAQAVFEKLGDDPPEALVNLGILLDRAGDPQGAFDAWVAAKAKGAKGSKLEEWIDTKHRIFGY